MDSIENNKLVIGLGIGFIIGLLIGWLAIGWWIWPVEWTDADPSLLRDDFKEDYVFMTARIYRETQDKEAAITRMSSLSDGTGYTCSLARQIYGGADKQNLLDLAQVLSPGINCDDVSATTEETSSTPSVLQRASLLCGAGAILAVIVGAVYWFVLRRSSDEQPLTQSTATNGTVTRLGSDTSRTIPLAQFPTEYSFGDDNFDDSFSIETAQGEFLGECGIVASESIGPGRPRRITAFELWLFDKNDIRTVTKVLLSEHAYHDQAIRAKLAPKGEAIQSQPGATVVLETAALIINARIVEMDYGQGDVPPKSFFDHIVVELAAWAKETAESQSSALSNDFSL
ncbi:MAG: hypothetical protein ABFQ89_06665 [Chloroflexota bacterium]